MGDFPPLFYAVIRALDRFSDVTGKLISLSMLWLVASISYECFSRYLFNAPTVWVLESSYMTNGAAFMLGCAYTLYKGAHVRTDMLWEKYSERKKGWIDLVSYSGGLPLAVIRAFPDARVQDAIVSAARDFEKRLAEAHARYRNAVTKTRAIPTERPIREIVL